MLLHILQMFFPSIYQLNIFSMAHILYVQCSLFLKSLFKCFIPNYMCLKLQYKIDLKIGILGYTTKTFLNVDRQ